LQSRQPIFNAPGVVLGLVGLLFAVHLVRWVLPPEEDLWLTLAMAFIPVRLAGHAGSLPGGQLAALTSFVTYAFVHGNLTHLLINSAWLLAFGSPVARRIGAVRFLLFFFLTGSIGALAYFLVNGATLVPVVGASGAISGLMGATFRFLFLGAAGEFGGPRGVPPMSLAEALRDRRIQLVIVVATLLNGLQAWGAGIVTDGEGIAWEAHLGGFYAGLLLYGLFERMPPASVGTARDAAPAC
jgi:membrane associated rhomboid family serine protease